MKKILIALAFGTLSTATLALEPMPRQAGFSGSFAVGAAGGTVDSNFLAKIIGIDLGNDKTFTYDAPNETTIIIPTFKFSAGYTFASRKTRLSFGSAIDSTIDFTANTVLALRQDFDTLGSVEIAGLVPSIAPVEVWEDPYLKGDKRRSTEKTSSGGRLTWDRIVGSNFELIGTFRSVDVDKERSGDSTGLDPAERKLLDREGDVTRIELGYAFNVDGNNLRVRPNIAYLDHDLDGKAMAQDGYELGIQTFYNAGSYRWLNRAVYQRLDGDAKNPLFPGKKNDADVYLLASEVQVLAPFGWDKWATSVGVSWGEYSAAIDFNKASAAMFVARIGRSF